MKSIRYTAAGLGTAFALGLGAAPATGAGVQTIEKAKPGDWPSYHRTYDAQRYSPLNQINKKNVGKMQVAWVHQPGEITQGLQATPIAIDGIVYYSSSYNRTFAVDGRTGETIWRYIPKIKDGVDQLPTAPPSRGVAVANGMVFIGTIDGRGIALDQKTGAVKWETQIVDTMACGCMFT
jgi:alcohol dehydrogenase (cytochrome c)